MSQFPSASTLERTISSIKVSFNKGEGGAKRRKRISRFERGILCQQTTLGEDT